MRFTLLVAAVFALGTAVPSSARLLWADTLSNKDRRDVILPSFGSAVAHVSVLHPLDSDQASDVSFTSSPLYEVGPARIERGVDKYNYTYEVQFNGRVGVAHYTVNVHGDELKGSFVVAGVVIRQDGVVVSGDDGAGVVVGHEGLHALEVEAVGTDGRKIDLSVSDNIITPMAMNGHVYMEEVDRQATSFTDNDQFILGISKFRVGTGAFILGLEVPAIEHDGETYETVLHVSQPTSPRPPCVVDGHDLVSRNGKVTARMYNLLTEEDQMKRVSITVGGQTVPADLKSSSLKVPTSHVVFRNVPTEGRAVITCGNEVATVVDDRDLSRQALTVRMVSAEDVDSAELDQGLDLELPAVVRLASTDAFPSTKIDDASRIDVSTVILAVSACMMAAGLLAAATVSGLMGKRRVTGIEEAEHAPLGESGPSNAVYEAGEGGSRAV